VDLTSYVGQTVRVKFLVHQDGSGALTGMFVDDAQLTLPCGGSISPDAWAQGYTPTEVPPDAAAAPLAQLGTEGGNPREIRGLSVCGSLPTLLKNL
jgi:hypothetical protein